MQSVEFHYSRLLNQRAIWGGQDVTADSMEVVAMSRAPGTFFYTVYDRRKIYSNVPSTSPPWNVWTPVKLQANGDRIQWLELRGQLMIDDVKITRRPLVCTSVIRGTEVRCEVASATLSVTGWDFQPDSVPGLPALPGIHDTSTSKLWRGIAVVGGTVTAHVNDGSSARTLTARFTVTVRPSSWASKQAYRVGPELTAPDAEPGVGVRIGRNCPEINGVAMCVPTLRVQPDPTQLPGDGNTVGQVPSGPNQGYWFVQSAIYEMRRVGNVNPAILATSTRVHPLPANTPKKCKQALGFNPNAAASANFNQYNDKCQTINMTNFINGAYGHEGFGYGGGQGHESLARTAAAELKNDPYIAIDPLVYTDSVSVKDEADRRVAVIGLDILNKSADPLPSGNWAGGQIWFWDGSALMFRAQTINGF